MVLFKILDKLMNIYYAQSHGCDVQDVSSAAVSAYFSK